MSRIGLLGVTGPALLALVSVMAEKAKTRDVLVVSNNWAGTADLVDPHKFKRLERINVIPTPRSAWPRSPTIR